MATSNDMNQLYESTQNLNALAQYHAQAVSGISSQVTIMANTTSQLVSGYQLYGLENGLLSGALSGSNLPGLTAPSSGLTPPDATKLLPLPEVGPSLEERLAHFGHHPPVPSAADGMVLVGTGAPFQSVLPWTPHPQHSYKDNSTRVVNRTGRKRPSPVFQTAIVSNNGSSKIFSQDGGV